ncbi:MAG: hypothetical protein H6559_23525 [Lewinellaceae bacterium]|nr:hypothetical protein [Lewinellaceae bacterium]
MISLKTSYNIFYNKRVILDYLGSDLFESGDEMKHVNWLELRISGEGNEERFEEFLEAFFSLLKKDFLISIFCYERSEKVKNRLRSYGKLFYELRKEKFIGDQFLIEKELNTDENHSVFAGIIQVDEIDNEIILNEILGNYFRFGYAEFTKNGVNDSNALESLMKHVDFKLLRKGKLIEVDYLSLLNKLIVPTSMVFSYLFDGKDDLVFTVYSGSDVFNPIENIILQSVPKDSKLEKINASADEVDRLIDSYFKDWRTV